MYVQGLKVNGKEWTPLRLPHELLASGGVLEFQMGPKPSSWGTGKGDAPSSITQDDEVPSPPVDLTRQDHDDALLDDTSGTHAVFTRASLDVAPASRGERVTSYTLTSADRGDAPRAWVLEGSDDGSDWTAVDRRGGESFAWDRQTRVFDVARPGTYRHYRLVPGGKSSLSEIELLG